VEHIEYEKDLVRQTNLGSQYDCLFITNKLPQPISFGHNSTSVQMLGGNN